MINICLLKPENNKCTNLGENRDGTRNIISKNLECKSIILQ